MIFLKNVDPFENVTYGSESVYELEYSVSSGNVSEPIYIPDVGKPVSMSLFPGSGASGYIECTNDIYSKIADGTAVWFKWPDGNVSANTSNIAQGVKALRIGSRIHFFFPRLDGFSETLSCLNRSA